MNPLKHEDPGGEVRGGSPTAVATRRTARRGLVARDRLTARLVSSADAPVALLLAPAGYGKTTVIAQWEAADERPFVWITLEDHDNDPARLLGGIATALTDLGPVDQAVFDALSAPRPSIINVVLPRLIDAVAALDRPFVLVLDDLHRIADPVALKALSVLAEHIRLPSQLALVGHMEPGVGIGRLRAHGRVVELNAKDLVMTRSEAAELIRGAGFELGPGAIRRLVERTEGWPAALYLATLTLGGESDPAAAIEHFAGDDRLVADYLREEFLSRQSHDDLRFLTATSILDRLTGPLCDAVAGCEGSAETLRRLSRANLLLVPLDRRDEQYRYHALLREMLAAELHRLGAGRESELHMRASRWYAAHGDFDRAVPHAIAAGDRGEAGRLIWAKTPEYESGGRGATLRRWLDRFTDEDVGASPELCLASAVNYSTMGNGGQVERWTAAATSAVAGAPPAERRPIEVAAALVRAVGAARNGVVRMRKDVVAAASALPDESRWRSVCSFLEGVADHLTAERVRARTTLGEAVRRAAPATPNIHTLALAQLALLEIDEDDADAASTLTLQAMAKADRVGLVDYPTSALLFAVAALVRARHGRVEHALRDAKRCDRLLGELTDFSPWYEAETRIVAARALLLLDDVPSARRLLNEAEAQLHSTPDATVLEDWRREAERDAESVGELGDRWPLTKAELRLLRHLPSHLSFREIGEELFVSTNTVKTQAQAVYRKLGVSSRAEAVATAQAAGLVPRAEARG
jgi:LuxR family transcriptional regulator, maltose regulon positive regulatory protein